eukprot:scaffold264_cov188-Alexandrium_tamarense.AAC.10
MRDDEKGGGCRDRYQCRTITTYQPTVTPSLDLSVGVVECLHSMELICIMTADWHRPSVEVCTSRKICWVLCHSSSHYASYHLYHSTLPLFFDVFVQKRETRQTLINTAPHWQTSNNNT